MRKLAFFVFSLVFIFVRLPSAYALDLSKFEHLVVFGDSLSDNGNSLFLTQASSHPLPPPPYGTTYSSSGVPGEIFPGRWTDGQNWVDYFPGVAESFGVYVPAVTAYLQDSQNDNATNFAIGGATSGEGNAISAALPGFQAQIVTYLHAVRDQASPNDLYVIWIGANDFSAGINPAQTVANIKDAIATLSSKGARTFVVINVPDMSLTPQVKSLGGATVQEAKQFVITVNVLLDVELLPFAFLNRITIELVDINAIFIPLVYNPGEFGFTNSTGSALAALAANPSINPNDYLFWDDFHPTTNAHGNAAEFIYKAVASKRTFPKTLPIPLARLDLSAFVTPR
jgi:phospholipase/lecithinase/hemolysin